MDEKQFKEFMEVMGGIRTQLETLAEVTAENKTQTERLVGELQQMNETQEAKLTQAEMGR